MLFIFILLVEVCSLVKSLEQAGDPPTHPLAVTLHVAALEGTVESVSVEFLQQSAAAAKDDVLSTPAFISQLLENLHRRTTSINVVH